MIDVFPQRFGVHSGGIEAEKENGCCDKRQAHGQSSSRTGSHSESARLLLVLFSVVSSLLTLYPLISGQHA